MRRNVEVEDLGVCSKLRLQRIGVRQGGCVGVDASAWWAWRSGAPALRGVRWATPLWSGRSGEWRIPPPPRGFRVLEKAFPGRLPAPGV